MKWSKLLFPVVVSKTVKSVPKICKNCKFYVEDFGVIECSKFSQVDLVTGRVSRSPASSVRMNPEKCGEEGLMFEKNNYKFVTVPYFFFKNYGLIFIPSIIYVISLGLHYTR